MDVLVVDASKVLREAVELMCEHGGFLVRSAGSAQAAIETLDDRPADILLLNPDLPGNSGIELLCEVQSYDDFKNIKTVLMADKPELYGEHNSSLKELGVELVVARKSISSEVIAEAIEHIEFSKA